MAKLTNRAIRRADGQILNVKRVRFKKNILLIVFYDFSFADELKDYIIEQHLQGKFVLLFILIPTIDTLPPPLSYFFLWIYSYS